MCGIYGAFAPEAEQKVLAGLKRLEYRGYDSWGIAVLNRDLQIEKYVGKIGEVRELTLPVSKIALGHTRWATHGGVTQANAHPHMAANHRFVLVQNGVLENYQKLKAELRDKSYEFVSDTDTEVIVHLIEEEMKQQGETDPSMRTISKIMQLLDGRSTVGVLGQNGTVWLYRNGSPLVLGKSEKGEFFFSSDVLSLATDADEYSVVEHEQLVCLTTDGFTLFENNSLKELALEWKHIDVESNVIDKDGYSHFMLKEIFEQADVLTDVVKQSQATIDEFVKVLTKSRQIYVLGAGSASFAAGAVALQLRECGLVATELKSYEARSFKQLFSNQDLVIALSQSGETADTNEVVEWMKEKGMKVASVVNMAGSTLTAMSDFPFMLGVGPEVAIASTKAFTGHIVWGLYLAQLLQGATTEAFVDRLQKYQQELRTWLESTELQHQVETLAQQLIGHEHMFVLGRGQLYVPALEFALKMKEISYIHAEGFSGGELKHGVIALISPGTPVICLVTDDDEKADMLSAAAEVRARGGYIIGVAAEENELFHECLPVPANADFALISSYIPAQLLTYHMATLQGFDPDKPRNLAKSVTVK